MRLARPLSTLLLLTAFVLQGEARAASLTAWAWSYETSETHSGPVTALAEIARQAAGAAGESHAGASAVAGALSSYSRIRGCGSQFNNFQQVCNDARSGSESTDTLIATASLPYGSPVQVRVTMRLEGEVNGHGGYSYDARASLQGQTVASVGGSAGTVQVVDHLSIADTKVFDTTMLVGYSHPLSVTLSTLALQRFCAGGSQDCYDSEHTWTIFTGASTSVQIEVLTTGVNAQLTATSGHDYTLPTTGVPRANSAVAQLGPAWPNPAHERVQLLLTLAERSDIDAAVFDVAGRRVATLARGVRESGVHALVWNGRDAGGGGECRGVFFVRAQGPAFRLTRRVLMTRP
ncbi:MAG: hypothetical protein IT348_19560 [Candidatus Eisenbacteria bacterium]|nr:hypothetical protein [Candidatus Eisenbacteria bacterium]